MEEEYFSSEKENAAFFDKPSQPEFVWKNLAIGIAVVVVVIFFIYLGISSTIKPSDYKPMDLSTKSQDSPNVQGASDYGPPDPGKSTTQQKNVVSPSPTVAANSPTATPQPTAAPTSAPTSHPNPTAVPTTAPSAEPSVSPDTTISPSASPSGEPSP